MDFIILFFRDILDGPLYWIIVVINSILICSCIGYLGERYLNKKKTAHSGAQPSTFPTTPLGNMPANHNPVSTLPNSVDQEKSNS